MQVRTTAYGPEALDRLTELVGELKADDPMRAVRVVVPSNVAGLAARRHLVRGVGGRRGVAGLEVTTLPRWAELLAGQSMVPRRPATQPVVAAAIHRGLTERGGPLARVAGHPATIQALTRAHAELLEVDAATLDVIAQTSLVTGEVVGSDAPTLALGSANPAPTSCWERISRAAGVVKDEDWQRSLDQHVVDLQARPVVDEKQRIRTEVPTHLIHGPDQLVLYPAPRGAGLNWRLSTGSQCLHLAASRAMLANS